MAETLPGPLTGSENRLQALENAKNWRGNGEATGASGERTKRAKGKLQKDRIAELDCVEPRAPRLKTPARRPQGGQQSEYRPYFPASTPFPLQVPAH